MASHCATLFHVTSPPRADRHTDPALTVRPPADLKTQAQQLLADRDREMRGFVVACLAALKADPDGFLGRLADHWPAPKPRGRPHRATGDA